MFILYILLIKSCHFPQARKQLQRRHLANEHRAEAEVARRENEETVGDRGGRRPWWFTRVFCPGAWVFMMGFRIFRLDKLDQLI